MKHTLLAALGILAATGCSTGALAAPVTVDATGEIYSAGQATAQYGGSLPTVVNLSSGTASLTFSGVQGSISCTSSAGCITMDNGGHYNDADGTGGASTLNGTGTTGLSGITAPGAGWLVGVLVASGGPSGSAPTALDFTTGSGTSFTSLSPQLDQVFFIGDGLTGDGAGTTQTFYVPTGAATLYLGIADACSYSGAPSCYNDNSGTYSLTVNQSADALSVPEPSGWAVLGFGLVGLAVLRRTVRAS